MPWSSTSTFLSPTFLLVTAASATVGVPPELDATVVVVASAGATVVVAELSLDAFELLELLPHAASATALTPASMISGKRNVRMADPLGMVTTNTVYGRAPV